MSLVLLNAKFDSKERKTLSKSQTRLITEKRTEKLNRLVSRHLERSLGLSSLHKVKLSRKANTSPSECTSLKPFKYKEATCSSSKSPRYNTMVKRLHSEIVQIASQTKKTVDSMKIHIAKIIENVTTSVQDLWSDSTIETFGSYSTGLWLPTSDVDLVILVRGCGYICVFYYLTFWFRMFWRIVTWEQQRQISGNWQMYWVNKTGSPLSWCLRRPRCQSSNSSVKMFLFPLTSPLRHHPLTAAYLHGSCYLGCESIANFSFFSDSVVIWWVGMSMNYQSFTQRRSSWSSCCVNGTWMMRILVDWVHIRDRKSVV